MNLNNYLIKIILLIIKKKHTITFGLGVCEQVGGELVDWDIRLIINVLAC